MQLLQFEICLPIKPKTSWQTPELEYESLEGPFFFFFISVSMEKLGRKPLSIFIKLKDGQHHYAFKYIYSPSTQVHAKLISFTNFLPLLHDFEHLVTFLYQNKRTISSQRYSWKMEKSMQSQSYQMQYWV